MQSRYKTIDLTFKLYFWKLVIGVQILNDFSLSQYTISFTNKHIYRFTTDANKISNYCIS